MAFETRASDATAPSGFGDLSAFLLTETRLWRSFGIDLPLRLAAGILTFGSRRLQAQADHLAALGRCGSPAELLKEQSGFLTQALTDYQREAAVLSQNVVDTAVPLGIARAA
ncbi:phasin family protein [Methylobacterium sp. JK268]